jgi:membrane protein YqaA with SNARE-associated domain
MNEWMASLLAALALPQFGLSSVFVVSFVSATLLPMGSEAVVLGLLVLNPALFWEVMAVATAGNAHVVDGPAGGPGTGAASGPKIA